MKKTLAAAFVVLVPTLATAADPKASGTDPLRRESVQAPAKPGSDVRLNLNKASPADLARLPGVGEARAKAIVKGRPYRSKEELLRKKILPENVYEDVKASVYAGT